MFSNKEVLQNDSYFEDKGLKYLMAGTIPFVDRITSGPSLIMLIAFFIMLILCIIFAIDPHLFPCEVPEERSKKSLLEHMSYNQLMKEYNETLKEVQIAESDCPRLAVKLKEKLNTLGDGLKYHFAKYNMKVDELTEEMVDKFYREHREVLNKSGMKGLVSYRLMVIVI